MSIRLMNAPNNYPFTNGWGLYPERQSDIDRRRPSAKRLLGVIDGTKNVNAKDWQFALGTLEVAFRSVAGESTRDWFTLANHLGQPSRALAHDIYECLRRLKELDRRSEAASDIFERLDEMALPDILQAYRSSTSEDDPQPTDIREGWCHILWSHDRPDQILVGAVHGNPLEVVSVLDRRAPGIRHGVLAAWQVEDPDWAATQIARTFALSLDQIGLAAVPASEGFARVKLLTENAVWKTIVRSPWHIEGSDASMDEQADVVREVLAPAP
ncbi:hypothetical protein Rleg_1523 [Rhizobium leguminosarum bv. trifolii WSM1325]|uniref:Uncharacterized protein n=1 Tax=Rhizobium leguminosarum bv. trifolii (strain WSM1325) TaxID=395491 RepID=C6AVK2_RHILS|nr:hypothetical protein [Rhizobium leguminosarum]ACS55813.1 hypothetical protein Rleg_1523 [Rhizobium leguminosarum bv. trifolii WSM1325]